MALVDIGLMEIWQIGPLLMRDFLQVVASLMKPMQLTAEDRLSPFTQGANDRTLQGNFTRHRMDFSDSNPVAPISAAGITMRRTGCQSSKGSNGHSNYL